MTRHLRNYLERLDTISPGVSPSVKKTIDEIIPKHISTFTFKEHITGLLLGNVQSGKTSQVLGVIAAAADEGMELFVLLTTDNVYLHQQTLIRALESLDTFNVCGEDDELRFIQVGMRKPVIVVLKKNTNILKKWKNNLSSSKFCEGRSLFIVDDEGDAASLNTKINKNDQSAINRHLEEMKKMANSSIYMQVTATPQPLLLQSKISEWSPQFIHYYPPGKGYLGGDFFYSEPPSYVIRLTEDDELDDLLQPSEEITLGLRDSLLSFLIAGAHIFKKGQGKVCNFLVHPSVRIADHEEIADKLGGYLNEMLEAVAENHMQEFLKQAWIDMQKTKPDILPFDEIHQYIINALNNQDIKVLVMNSRASQDIDYSEGLNIIVGGNSLGRGVTFRGLQTVYYCRRARTPQADTFWQHCRMFGYDRDSGLMRVYLPPLLLKLFTELNNANRALIAQVAENNIQDVSLLYPPGIKPTRTNVVDRDKVEIIVGGVNYFPNYPKGKYTKKIDEALESFDERAVHEIKLQHIIDLLEYFESHIKADWSNKVFINCIKALRASKAENKGLLLVRRGRNIGKGTGTLLSEDDRKLGSKITNYPVLTLYRLTGDKNKGWEGKPLWVPNIKLPTGRNFYKSE